FVLFIVRDTGLGISDELLDVIFEPFVQGEGSFIRRYQGAGLGLSIVARLLRLLGGELSVESAPGEGTAMYVSIPFKMPALRAVGAEARDRRGSGPDHAGLRILVAEDDSVTGFTVKKLLENAGHQVTVTADGQEALGLLGAGVFDLILMDIQMPTMDGVQATRTIRFSDRFEAVRDIPIIAMTAYAMSGDREKFLAAGMDDYIAKPVDFAVLKAVIERVMARRDAKA
ncbi:MAG TPA: response regulator, partial [Holophaga sp.]|nr:response regulator [Holophaga sp.]